MYWQVIGSSKDGGVVLVWVCRSTERDCPDYWQLLGKALGRDVWLGTHAPPEQGRCHIRRKGGKIIFCHERNEGLGPFSPAFSRARGSKQLTVPKLSPPKCTEP